MSRGTKYTGRLDKKGNVKPSRVQIHEKEFHAEWQGHVHGNSTMKPTGQSYNDLPTFIRAQYPDAREKKGILKIHNVRVDKNHHLPPHYYCKGECGIVSDFPINIGTPEHPEYRCKNCRSYVR
jgi:hypothetical protein